MVMTRVLEHPDPEFCAQVAAVANKYVWHGTDNARAQGCEVWMKPEVFIRMIDEGVLKPGPALTAEGAQLIDRSLEQLRSTYRSGH